MPLLRREIEETQKLAEEVKTAMEEDFVPPIEEPIEKREWGLEELLPTGSTYLNLALSDNPYGGYGKGKLANIIGDSSSGKTILALTSVAEIVKTPNLANYRIIYDEPENALAIDLDYMFGKAFSPRVEFIFSNTIQDFYYNIYKACKDGTPFIYILDSLDSLTSKEEKLRASKMVKSREKAEESGAEEDKQKGSYKLEIPKLLPEILRLTCEDIKNTESAVWIISQTREDIGVTFGSKKTRSGGKALKFYCTHELWLAVENHEKHANGLEIGVNTIAKVSKNKLTGKVRYAYFPIYYDYGIDDIASSIDFLVENSYWKKAGRKIKITGIWAEEVEMEKKEFISYIEEHNLENNLKEVMHLAWKEREDSARLNRKPRF
jgi:recombination protein RecA